MGGVEPHAFVSNEIGVGNLAVAEEGIVPRHECLAIIAVAALDGAPCTGEPGGDTVVVGREFAECVGRSGGLPRRRPAAGQRQVTRYDRAQDHRIEPQPERQPPHQPAGDRHRRRFGQTRGTSIRHLG